MSARRKLLTCLLLGLSTQGGRARAVAAAPATEGGSAGERYAHSYIGFENTTIIHMGPFSNSNLRPWTPYQGKFHRPLEGAQFYYALQRDDLLARYWRRAALRGGLLIGGMATSFLGLYVFLTSNLAGGYSTLIGLSVAVGGNVAFWTGWYLPHDPINESEARQAVDLHNKELKRGLGLDPLPSAEPSSAPNRLTIAPMVLPRGGALVLGGTF
jgi:hypothetical protein